MACGLSLAMGGAVSAQEDGDARAVYDRLYGDAIEAARSTSTGEDDLALAGQMLDAARMSSQAQRPSAELVEMLSVGAYDLAYRQDGGLGRAVEAMRLRAEVRPALAIDSSERIVAAYQQHLGRSDPEARARIGESMIDELQRIIDLAERRYRAVAEWVQREASE